MSSSPCSHASMKRFRCFPIIWGTDKPNRKWHMMNSLTCTKRWHENLLLWPIFVDPWQNIPFRFTCFISWYVISAIKGSRYNCFTTNLHWHPLRWPDPRILADVRGHVWPFPFGTYLPFTSNFRFLWYMSFVTSGMCEALSFGPY